MCLLLEMQLLSLSIIILPNAQYFYSMYNLNIGNLDGDSYACILQMILSLGHHFQQNLT